MYQKKVAILNHSGGTQLKAEALAEKLQVVLNPMHLEDYDFALQFNQDKLELLCVKEKNTKPIFVNLANIHLKRVSFGDSLLAKAVGIKPHESLSVVDACGGLGLDAFTLALLGCKVVLLERSPIIFELLKNGLDRIPQAVLKERPLLIAGDAIDYLKYLENKDYPDVICLDPMYPIRRNKKILAKKEMQVLHALVGSDEDSPILLEQAILCAKKRVVVKRRRLDPCLGEKKANFSYIGKVVRFDVYTSSGLLHKE